MRSIAKRVMAGAIVIAAASLAGCGEREQVIVYKQGRYQGKPDTQAWQNDPAQSLYTTSKWVKGDKASWEAALRTRDLNQNDYTRSE